MRQRVIELHIDELVLTGLCPRDRRRIVGAMQRELQRLSIEPGASPEAAGAQVAQAVHRGAAASVGAPVKGSRS